MKLKSNIEKFQRPVTIAIDFDGVIHPYTGYKGPGVFNPPYPEAAAGLKSLRQNGYKILIYSCRGEVGKIRSYLNLHDLTYDYIGTYKDEFSPKGFIANPSKVFADIYVDDRALKFNGSWPDLVQQVDSFTLWYKRPFDKDKVGYLSRFLDPVNLIYQFMAHTVLPFVTNEISKATDEKTKEKLLIIKSGFDALTETIYKLQE